MNINVIGGGLAGVEVAYKLSKNGILVNLYEMRPQKMTNVHQTPYLAEVVCSNSFKSKELRNAKGLLKYEMDRLDSLVLKMAYRSEVPAGKSLNIDREKFAKLITGYIENDENINIIREEKKDISEDELNIIATGPLTSEALSANISKILNKGSLYFYDALSPIIDGNSIDKEKTFYGLRYEKGEGKILNFPMDKEEYLQFYNELINAEKVKMKDVDSGIYFEACLPVEEIAQRGEDALRFGPLRPVGFREYIDHKPYAVAQARPETALYDSFELIGFQTRLTFSEQKRVLSLIPGLEKAKIIRYGIMHRNTYINSPEVLNKYFQTKNNKNLFFAGQITGVEGYVESAASGIITGLVVTQMLKSTGEIQLPDESTMIGNLIKYITTLPEKKFQPMSSNYGLIKREKKEKREDLIERSKISIEKYREDQRKRGVIFD
ncbi:methylenetetrahydrofolate--tRNA-(uracil(54)-C(5))-methyltransferase (FADH(2)-oxidizing) TrmFO [bacterium]|nr:methylenetetrahydrofolate--tRNA-(uracil(54)-C(5))-methyltransferase (FADH(2)-oxidizing) TrmFO [bacterium]